MNRCEACKYFSPGAAVGPQGVEPGQGECRRYPPRVAGLIQQQHKITGQGGIGCMTAFPTVNAKMWCGMFEVRVVLAS